jgi:hypothetical protein
MASAGATGTTGATGAAGSNGLPVALRGTWSSGTAYVVNDAVTLSGSSYACTTSHTNQQPPNAGYWMVMASAGSTGAAGTAAPTYGGTSTTSLAIATGSKAWTLASNAAGYAYAVGARVRGTHTTTPAKYMEGVVTAYNSGTLVLTVSVDNIGGSGTFAAWTFNLAGTNGASGLVTEVHVISDVKEQGTDGGTSVTTTWTQRVLNTIVSSAGATSCSLASNQFTLAAGTYRIVAHAPAYSSTSNFNKIRIATSGGTAVAVGTSGFGNTQAESWLHTILVVGSSTTYQLQHYVASGTATTGLGRAMNFASTSEVYAEVEIMKIA